MYKKASQNLQHAACHIARPVYSGDPGLTDEENYETLKEAYNALIFRNKLETDTKIKKQNGIKLQEMMAEIAFFRDKVKKKKAVEGESISHFIIAIFKERCTRDEWESIKQEAKRRALIR